MNATRYIDKLTDKLRGPLVIGLIIMLVSSPLQPVSSSHVSITVGLVPPEKGIYGPNETVSVAGKVTVNLTPGPVGAQGATVLAVVTPSGTAGYGVIPSPVTNSEGEYSFEIPLGASPIQGDWTVDVSTDAGLTGHTAAAHTSFTVVGAPQLADLVLLQIGLDALPFFYLVGAILILRSDKNQDSATG